MPSSLHRQESTLLRTQLRAAREQAGITQVALSNALGHSQTWVSDIERGVRRVDAVELWQLCEALGLDLTSFIAEFQAAVEQSRPMRRRAPKARRQGTPRKRG